MTLSILDATIIILGLISAYLVGANNIASSLGILLSTRIVRKNTAYLLTVISSFSGTVINSYTMLGSIKSLIRSPFHELVLVAIITILFASSVAFYYLNKLGVPSSLSQMLYVGLLALVLVSRGAYDFDWLKFDLTVVSWILSPLIASVVSLATYSILSRRISEKSLISQIKYYKTFILLSSLVTSYVVGANAIGIIVSAGLVGYDNYYVISIAYGLASVIGILKSSLKPSIVVGFRITKLGYLGASSALLGGGMLSEVFTLFGIPISVTQTILGGIVGLSLRNLTKDVKAQLVNVAKGWLYAPVISTVISLAVFGVIRSILGL